VFSDHLFAGDGLKSIREELRGNTLSIGHFVHVYMLVENDENVERTAADAVLAAETRKVNEKWITKKKDCCITKAQKWHTRWQELQQVTGEDSAEVRRFMECADLDINLRYEERANPPSAAQPKSIAGAAKAVTATAAL